MKINSDIIRSANIWMQLKALIEDSWFTITDVGKKNVNHSTHSQ